MPSQGQPLGERLEMPRVDADGGRINSESSLPVARGRPVRSMAKPSVF
jgi:hypothetical protein